MADLALTVDAVIERLRAEGLRAIERLQQKAAELEHELRAVGSALEEPPIFDVTAAAAIHVFEVDTTTKNGLGYPLHPEIDFVLHAGGHRIGSSRLSRELPCGRYRAILQLTKIE